MIYLQALRNAMLSGVIVKELVTIYDTVEVSLDNEIKVELECES